MNTQLNTIFGNPMGDLAALSIRPQAAPRFAQTYCSQCGVAVGPGDSGVSRCRDHGPRPRYEAEIDTRVAGIPCLIGVVEFSYSEPDRSADNPYDYYGGAEMAWEVLDRKGRKAPWLERKLTDADRARIEQEIMEYCR
jgi:hypothetical protein